MELESYKELLNVLDQKLKEAEARKIRIERQALEMEEIKRRWLEKLEDLEQRPLFDQGHKFLIGLSLFEFLIILYLLLK